MWKYGALLLCLSGYCLAGPVGVTKRNVPIGQKKVNEDAANPDEMLLMSSLTLPSNATSIRADITDNFSCENKAYGYYADVENDCQIFHVCLPVTYADGKENTFRWSFICPEETIFSQESFTCMRPDDMVISCEESLKYYQLNDNFGNVEQEKDKETNEMPVEENEKPSMVIEPEPEVPLVPMKVQKPNRRKPSVPYTNQKNTGISHPLRKVPKVPVTSTSDDQPMINEKEEAEVKPLNEEDELLNNEDLKPIANKFSRRPVTSTSNSFKDKMQNLKPENTNAIRSDLYNQKRKRPIILNKKPIEEEIVKVEEEEPVKELENIVPVEVAQETLEVSGPNAEEKVDIEPAKEESVLPQSNFSQMESDLSNSNTETQEADSQTQESEANEIVVKAEDPQPMVEAADHSNNAEETQVLEAFEEIPAVVEEVAEPIAVSNTNDDLPKEHEIPVVETVEEESHVAEEVPKVEEQPMPEEFNNIPIQNSQQEEQSAEDNVAIVEEQQPIEDNKTVEEPLAEEPVEAPEEDQQLSENIVTAEESQPIVETTNPEANVEKLYSADEPMAVESSPEVEKMPEEDMELHQEIMTADETPLVPETEMVKDDINKAEEEEVPAVVEEHLENTETQEEVQMNEEEIKSVVEPQEIENQENSQESQMSETNVEQVLAEEPMVNAIVPEEAENTEVMAEELPAVAEEEVTPNDTEVKSEEIPEKPLEEETMVIKNDNTVETEQEPLAHAEPAIFEENSEESVPASDAIAPIQTIEEMEDEKPAEAPESMPATEEMAEQDTPVQQMFEETIDEDKKQTIGGFKPVDPVMAAEAEQLIADFINTLRNNEFVDEKPESPMPMPVMEEQMTESKEDTPADAAQEDVSQMMMEEQPQSPQGEAEVVQEQQSEEFVNQPQIIEAHTSSEENNAEVMEPENKPSEELTKSDEAPQAEEVNNTEEKMEEELPKEEEKLVEVPSIEMTNMPQESYQIPVQIITTPLENMPQQEVAETQPQAEGMVEELPSNTEEKKETENEHPAVVMEGYKPLSIDDIVEMVKERLDQMPKDKLETPMQLEEVLEEAQSNNEEVKKEEQNEPSEEAQQTEEEVILPIYHRGADADAPVVPEEPAPISVSAEEEPMHSMLSPREESRKRRFFFRADAS